MEKRFIILVDFSAYSVNLIKYAYDWSKQANAEILLAHQTIVLAPGLADNESRNSMAIHTNDEAMQNLKGLAKELIPPSVKVSYLVSDKNLQSTLPNLSAEPFENLIFVGIKGTGLLKKVFLGSVALEVIENVKEYYCCNAERNCHFFARKNICSRKRKTPVKHTKAT